jgi:hypothetical protein
MTYRSIYRRGQLDIVKTSSIINNPACRSAFLRKLSCVMAIAIIFFALELHAQTSTVIGTILYGDHRAAVNVFVSIGGLFRYTDVGGRYKLAGVPQGRQHMIIKKGTRVLWQGDVNISGTIATIDKVLP